jgi:hypothetical protein
MMVEKRTAENFGKKERVGKEAPLLLNMRLSYGDIIIMAGEEMQQYYEVSNIYPISTSIPIIMLTTLLQRSVDHEPKLRFALTYRYIDPKSLSYLLGMRWSRIMESIMALA